MKRTEVSTIDDYITNFPPETRKHLMQVRDTIRKSAPQATEAIKYAIPTFVLNGNLVHFAGYEKHIGFYPAPTGMDAFKKELAPYKQGKGSVQFPIDKPMPLALIRKIVAYRVKQSLEKAKGKAKKK
jgi:uncharacterized protein YdhG (YjbR/CyaY superfamily)